METENINKYHVRVSRIRRAVFSYGTTAICLIVPSAFVFLGYESALAGEVARNMLGYAQFMAALYLGAGVIDGSGVLSSAAKILGDTKTSER